MKNRQKRLLNNRIAALMLSAALVAPVLTAFYGGSAQSVIVEASAHGKEHRKTGVNIYSLGPGYQSLPYSDTYGDYQWALLNSGVFKLVPSTKTPLESTFQGWLGGQNAGQNRPGPARESEGTTLAVAGIDINIIPAWKKLIRELITAILIWQMLSG